MPNTGNCRLIRHIARVLLIVVGCYSSACLALPTHTINRGEWSLISIPADPGSTGTVQLLFGDDLPVDRYGAGGGWVIYAFDAANNAYRELQLSDTLMPNTGYWFIQTIRTAARIDVPDSLSPIRDVDSPACPIGVQCAAQPLNSGASGVQWNLVGFSSTLSATFGGTRFRANNACANGCNPVQAREAAVAGDIMFRYSGEDAATPFQTITSASSLQPWDGFWVPVLAEAVAPVWVLPLGDGSVPGVQPTAAEIDASRLLMQASFGPTDAAIEQVIELGGAAAWVDAQLALPVQRHLPLVKQQYPDEEDIQQGRYVAFWERALRANDQLRQRVAFALSEIMVVSDRSSSIRAHGNLTAAYYDILVDNAFGNFRNLLEDVTLSPAMGVYLSMLGNERPDAVSGRRADENYARELMQLFSIGLVELNIDGTERAGTVTYSQPDVENLARVFTGWSWDKNRWDVNPRGGWRPDRTSMERPMRAFPERHDTDAKLLLGTTIPAGQTPAADLAMALDILFRHPNVGPFIAKQLIKRLVTSNPSPAYVRRVATVFNNNGDGERGDLGAVVRAILLDQSICASIPVEIFRSTLR